MKVTLQEFSDKEPIQQVIDLTEQQEVKVKTHGWPDALQLTLHNPTRESDLNEYEVYTLEDFNGDSATYTKVNHPLLLTSPVHKVDPTL